MKDLKIPAAFICVIIIWSFTPLAVQWSSSSAPFSSALIRMLVGVLTGIVIMGIWSMRLPADSATRRLYLLSGSTMYLSMCLIYISAQSIPSGWVAVIFGLSPLITGVLSAFIEPDSKLSFQRIVGITLGLAGLVLIFRVGLVANQSTIPGISICTIAVFISASSSVFIRQLSKDTDLQPMQINVGSLLVAIPLFALTAVLMESPSNLSFSQRELFSTLFLGVIGTGIGFTLYFYLLKHLPASKVALVTLITPITALLVGNILNQEPVIREVWLGAFCVCIGLLLYQYKPRLGLRKL